MKFNKNIFFSYITVFFITSIFNTAISQNYKRETHSINGVWQEIGYGRIVEISDSKFKLYDYCNVGCVLSEKGSIDQLEGVIGAIVENATDSITTRSGITRYNFVRINEPPQLCSNQRAEQNNDPVYNFDVLWHTFNEHYAYFQQRNVGWEKQYKTYRPLVTNETNEVELYRVFLELLESIGDGHVTIDVPDSISKSLKSDEGEKKPAPKRRISKWEASIVVAKYYLKEKLKSHPNGLYHWGLMENGGAYLQINRIFGFSDYVTVPEWLSGIEYERYFRKAVFSKIEADGNWFDFEKEETASINKIMDSIIHDLQHAKFLIIDLRFNGGGFDGVAIEIMNHFVDKSTKVFSKKARLGNNWTTPQHIWLQPSEVRFDRDVVLLTSPKTASAAEIMVLSSMALDNFMRVGESTMGIFSDVLNKKLPNGWNYTLSNEIYENINKQSYESIGIPPDYQINYPSYWISFLADLKPSEKGDPAIELSLSKLSED